MANSSEHPVVIWIHGGGFWQGGAATPTENGSYIGTPFVPFAKLAWLTLAVISSAVCRSGHANCG